jgi:tetratricopeptide (TPR) repeat protein
MVAFGLAGISALGQTPAPATTPAPAKEVVVAPVPPAPKPAPDQAPVQAPDRATAYYHAMLADNYDELATTQGRLDLASRAIEEYKLALNADPGSASLTLSLAEMYLKTQHRTEAISTVRGLLKQNDQNLDAHKLLGRIYLRALSQDAGPGAASTANVQMLDQAIQEYTRIVALEPKSVENHLLLGKLLSVKHETAPAEAEFKAAEALEPASEDAVLSLAQLYAENKDLKRATELLEAVPEANRTTKIEFTLGAAYEEMKDLKKAIAAYRKAAELEPDNLDAVHALAQALLTDGQLDSALNEFKLLLAADPEDAATLSRISEIERRQGNYEEALATIRKARAKDPENLESGYNEGLLLDVLGRYDEAVDVYKKMVDLTEHANGAYTSEEKANRAVFLERLGAVYHEEDKTTEAIASYQKMIDLGGEQAVHGYQAQVDTYRDAKMFDEATATCRKAVAANPDNRDLKLLLAWQLADTGKLDEGLALANGMLKGSAGDREVYLQISQIQSRLKHWKEAEDALTKAEPFAVKDEDKLNLLFQKGSLAEREKKYDQAEQYFRKVLEIDPNNALTLNNLGFMLVDKTTRFADALKLIRKAVELEPMNGAYLDSLGWVYFKMGDYEPAEDNLRKAVERTSTDPTVHDHLGDLYEKTNRVRLAAAQWELSLKEFAKSASADVEPAEVAKVQKKLEGARVRLAKQDSHLPEIKP